MDSPHGWRSYGWTFFVTVVLFAAVLAGGVGWALVTNGRKIDKTQTALTALCAQRHDLDQRIKSTSELLEKHPHAKFIFAIPRDLIVSSNKRDKTTRRNLEILDCKE